MRRRRRPRCSERASGGGDRPAELISPYNLFYTKNNKQNKNNKNEKRTGQAVRVCNGRRHMCRTAPTRLRSLSYFSIFCFAFGFGDLLRIGRPTHHSVLRIRIRMTAASRTAEHPNSRTAQQPNSRTADARTNPRPSDAASLADQLAHNLRPQVARFD